MNDTLYKFLISCATPTISYQQGKVYELSDETLINEFLNAGYIELYDGTLDIVENGLYNVKNYDAANVNVEGGGSFKVLNGMKFAYSSVLPESIDTSEVTNMAQMFYGYSGDSIPQINTSNVTIAHDMFSSSKLTSLPTMDTSKIEDMDSFCSNCTYLLSLPQLDVRQVKKASNFCNGCTNLIDVPLLNFSSIKETSASNNYMNAMFSNCTSLSNESLNNIMGICLTMSPYSTHKKLSKIGLSSAQASICQGLSNWTALSSAGWTTGY